MCNGRLHSHLYVKYWCLWLMTALLLVTAASAEQLPKTLTLEDCFRLALERNPNLKAAALEVGISRASLTAQKARWWPTLDIGWGARVQQSLPRPIQLPGGTIGSSSARSTSRDLALNLDQTFYQSGLRESIRVADIRVTSSRYSRDDLERRVLAQVAGAFYGVLGSLEMAEVARAGVEAVGENLELVNARVEVGNAAAVDRLPVEVELAEAELEMIRAMNSTWQMMADLRALLALEEGPAPLLSRDTIRLPEPGPLSSWVTEARELRPDLAVQGASVRAAELAVREARIAAGLSVRAAGSADYGKHTGTVGESWSLSVSATYPLGNRALRAEVAAAEGRREIARQRLADLQLNITRDVEQNWYGLRNATERISVAQVGVEAAQTNLAVAQQRYAEGLAIIVEITDAEVSLRRARANLIQARYDQNVAYYQLLAAAGRQLLPQHTINE